MRVRASGSEHGTRDTKERRRAQTQGAQENTQREGHRGRIAAAMGIMSATERQYAKDPH